MCGHCQMKMCTRLNNLKKKEKGLGGPGKLTNTKIDCLQNFGDVAIRLNIGHLKEMKLYLLTSFFHVASN